MTALETFGDRTDFLASLDEYNVIVHSQCRGHQFADDATPFPLHLVSSEVIVVNSLLISIWLGLVHAFI